MYYNNRETPKSTFSVDEVREAIINDSTIEDFLKKGSSVYFRSANGSGIRGIISGTSLFFRKISNLCRERNKRENIQGNISRMSDSFTRELILLKLQIE